MLTLPRTATDFLSGLEQHRQLTTLQLRDIYAQDRSLQWARRNLRLVLRRGLAGFSDIGSSHHRCWHLTRLGAEVVGSTRKALTEQKAAGPLQRHTLAVNEAGIAFLQAARVRGHSFEPEDWRHEVAHKLPGGRRFLIADAVLDYRIGSSLVLTFLELDNGTEQVRRLVEQLGDYAAFWRLETERKPGERLYGAFPNLLVLLAGKPRGALEQRLRTLVGLASQAAPLADLRLSFGLLEDLRRRGPFEPIFRRPHTEGQVNWRGESEGLKVVSTY